MRAYAGVAADDPRPVGGGKFNLSRIGSEVCNFKRRGDLVYGFFETPSKTDPRRTKLERIDMAAGASSALHKVLVVFVSRGPNVGQVVVGWYRNATALRVAADRPVPDDDYAYNCFARVRDCVLLPTPRRVQAVPWGRGAMGESNTCYPLESDGRPKKAAWMNRIVKYVDSYEGENLLTDPIADAIDEISEAVDATLTRSQGRFAGTAADRKALENYAVKKATQYFRRRGYSVEDVGARRSYDLECRRNGQELRVEVKATTTLGEQVILTPREARLDGNRALFVVHSIQMNRRGPAGGSVRIIKPWRIDRAALMAIGYMYRLPTTKPNPRTIEGAC